MKIAFLTPEYPHARTGKFGGIGTSIKNLATGLINKRCKVLVLVYGQSVDAVFEDDGITIHQIKNRKQKGISWYLTRKKIEGIINRLYKSKHIELVEAPDWTGITSFIQPEKCPIVIRLHGSDTYFCHLDKRKVKRINKIHEKRALQKANGLISVSEFTAAITNQVFNLTKEFTIIPNGIDTALFKKTEGTISNGNSILYFGTLIRKKGVLELPHIFNEVIKLKSNVELLLVGSDVRDILSGNSSTWELMQPLFSEEALKKVKFFGRVPYSEMKKHIEGASVCVFPTFAEALPVSWIEAMAVEKAVVASNVGWAKEVVDDGINGYTVHPTNHLKYATKIVELLNDEKLRVEFGHNARKKVLEKFTVEVVAKESLSFYENLINKNQ